MYSLIILEADMSFDENKMKLTGERKGRFTHTYTKYIMALQRRVLTLLFVCTTRKIILISTSVNQLLVPKSSIIENKNTFDEKQYEIRGLQLTTHDHKFLSQFNVITIYIYIYLGET